MLLSTQQLQVWEARQAERRRLNRQLVRPDLCPDTGAPLAGALQSAREQRHARAQAQAEAAETARSWLVLPPLPDLATDALPVTKGRPRTEPALGPQAARALDLLVHGASRTEAGAILALSRNSLDYVLRGAFAELRAHSAVGAAAAWRARAEQTGHKPDQGDLAALAALRPQQSPVQVPVPELALTPRQQQLLELAASGVRRRDLPARLGISPATVHATLNAAFRRLNARTLGEAIARAGLG